MMRDNLVSVIAKRHKEFGEAHARNASAVELADAIIAALPDMIPDLEWTKSCLFGHIHSGKYEIGPQSKDSYSVFIYDVNIGEVAEQELLDAKPISTHDQMDEAITAANAHHKAAIMAALGVSS